MKLDDPVCAHQWSVAGHVPRQHRRSSEFVQDGGAYVLCGKTWHPLFQRLL